MDLWRHATPAYFLALGFVCGLAGFRLGWRLRHRTALPLAQAVLGYLAFHLAWRVQGPAWAAAAVGAWAAGSTLLAIPTFLGNAVETDRRVIRAAPYREEMLAWLRTGSGPESRPAVTAARHLRELLVYLAAALVSLNVLGIALGAVLLGQMNAWVATLLRAARRTAVVLLLAWNVWSLVRVAAYVALGSACAAPLSEVVGLAPGRGSAMPLALFGAVGVILDLGLKLVLSRPCGRALAAAVDLEAAARGVPPLDRLTLRLEGPVEGPPR
jgi:hypothetical protein